VKSGIPAEMPKYLRPRKWPHFMEKKHKPKEQIYVSEKILGQLYDKAESVDFIPHYESPFDKRILRAYPEDRAILKSARQIKSQYDTAMRRIMAQHDIETEFEVWTSFVLSKPRVGSDYKVQEEMGIISSTLKARFKEICVEAAGGDDFKALGPFAAAMYQVTCEELAIALHECRTMKTICGRDVPKRKMEPKSMPLMSFPWIFQSVLGRIATGSEPTTLEDVGLSFVMRNEARAKKPRLAMSDEDDHEDYIETADGVTHRGELLDLFRPDAVDSDGDEVIPPCNIPEATTQVQGEPELKDDLDETPRLPPISVDLLANFLKANNQQEELLGIPEISECSRVNSHYEDLADLGGHFHDLANLDAECGMTGAEELLVDIAGAKIQQDGNDDEFEDGSDYGEEVTLDIGESALEQLLKLS
jgi:hypothetical protein